MKHISERRARVLVEHTQPREWMHGFTENYIKVELPYDERLSNEVRSVRLEGWNEDRSALKGEI